MNNNQPILISSLAHAFYSLGVIFLIAHSSIVSAQVLSAPPVNAGSLLEEVERQRPTPVAPRRGPALNLPPLMEPSAVPTAEFKVKQFSFNGNTKVKSAVLETALAGYLNRPIQFKDLQDATNIVADIYTKAGWLARAFIPQQDITEGTVRIHIIEAVYGGSKIQGNFKNTPNALIKRMVDSQNQQNQVLSLDDVERGLLLADDLPGVSVTGSLTAGQNTQETDVLVNVQDKPWVNGRIQIDNLGNKSTGANEVSVNAAINGLTGNADQLSVYSLYTEGLSFANVSYSIPLNYTGLRLGGSYSTLGYRIVDKDLQSLKGSGFANTWGLEATQPLIRSRNTNVLARLSYTNKLLDNRSDGISTSEYTVDVFSVGITATHLDSLGGGGFSTLSLIPSMGNVNYSLVPSYQRVVEATTQSEGQYSKLRYGLSRQQKLPEKFSIFANLRGQISSKNLDSSERFYLGGPYGVRAYPNNEGGGAQGNLLSVELRYNLMSDLQFSAFYDVGNVQVNKFNDNIPEAASAASNNGTLQGAGLSVSWNAPNNIILSAVWAIRVGGNPFSNDPARNQDGSSTRNRVWLNASIGF
jgi:hemolysin activation/secretion protein